MKNLFLKFLLVFILGAGLNSCTSVKKLAAEIDTISILKNSPVFSSHHTGFSLYDIDEDKFISNYHSNLKFTPASNTKLLTMYATLSNFNDSIPSLLYVKTDSNTLVRPIGDPTFLLEDFSYQPTYTFLTQQDSLIISPLKEVSLFGAGWMWDDYMYDFQVQRSWSPIYGNRVKIQKEDSVITITPDFFNEFVELKKSPEGASAARDRYSNIFSVTLKDDTADFERNIPFEYSEELFLQLLSDTLKSTPIKILQVEMENPDTLYSQHIDTVLAKMLKPSDNFLAEQLLLMCAWKNGFTEIDEYIDYVKSTSLSSLDNEWVDASGLSRYNLISPKDQVHLLKKSLDEFGWDRLTNILPTGGEGTLEERYLSETPFIYAKTGTLSNVHNLSGLLVTKSGKRLIFSLMNNHYTRSTAEVKKAMEEFLIQIRDAY